jgi:hypothetical protein
MIPSPDIFDEYMRRQYVAKAPERNPFGDEEEPHKFDDFDIFTKIRILHQLSLWTFFSPDRMRDKMSEASFEEQLEWRMEPFGWDQDDRTYFLLDDDRLYRQTEPPIPEPVRKKVKPRARGSRASKRRRISHVVDSTPEVEAEDGEVGGDTTIMNADQDLGHEENYEGRKWECIAITLGDYQTFIDGLKKSRDSDEKNLRKRLESEILPLLLGKEEERQRKELRRLKELENLQKLATAKRSSRLAIKQETQREQEMAQEAERKRLSDLQMARREQDNQRKLEADRESRMMTREQRLKEREVKRILHEEQLRLEAEQLEKLAAEEADGVGRMSQRQLKADMEKRQKELESLQVEEDWFFDCSVCGVHGENLDDGSHSIACDKCNVWQHSACHGIDKEQAELENFHFICNDCKRKAENPAPIIELKVGPAQEQKDSASTSPATQKKEGKEQKRSHIKMVKKSDKGGKNGTPDKKPRALKKATPKIGSSEDISVNGAGKMTVAGVQVPLAPLVYPAPPAFVARPPMSTTTASGAPATMHRIRSQSPLRYPELQPIQPTAQPMAGSPVRPQQQNYRPVANGQVQYVGYGPQYAQPILHVPQGYSQQPPSQSYPLSTAPGYHTLANSSSPVASTPVRPGPQHEQNGYHGWSSHQATNGHGQSHPPSTPVQLNYSRQANHFGQAGHEPNLQTTPSFPPPGSQARPSASLQSSPAPTLPTPHGGPSKPDVGDDALRGSSPGYSPVKHSSPPRSSPSRQSFGSGHAIVPPISLSPARHANITSPPVKKAIPPMPSMQSPVTVTSASVVARTVPADGQSVHNGSSHGQTP